MACSKPRASRYNKYLYSSSSEGQISLNKSEESESSVLQVSGCNDPLQPAPAASSPGITVKKSEQVLDCTEPLELNASSSDATITYVELLPECTESAGPFSYSANDIRNMWNLHKVFTRLYTDEQCIKFAEERNLIPKQKICSLHKRLMTLRTNGTSQLGMYRCLKSKCRTKDVSRARGTWFENARLSLRTIFQIMYMFCAGMSYHSVQIETTMDDELVLSRKTIADWYSYCREAITLYEIENKGQDKIGGPGKIVKIDEYKFGKRNSNIGCYVEGHWVLGMMEKNTNNLRLEVCPDDEKTVDALLPLILKHVEEGTEVHTNSWGVYECLPQYGFVHKKVDRRDPDNVAPNGPRSQQKQEFVDIAVEKNWRHRIMNKTLDPFEELLKIIACVYKVK